MKQLITHLCIWLALLAPGLVWAQATTSGNAYVPGVPSSNGYGTSGQCFTSNGPFPSIPSFQACTGSGSATLASTQVGFGSSGNALSGISGFTYNTTTGVLTMSNGSAPAITVGGNTVVTATGTPTAGQIATFSTGSVVNGSANAALVNGLTLGAPTGGDKGVGTLNATAIYVNGAAVGSAPSITAASTNLVASPSPITGTGTIDLASSPAVTGSFSAATGFNVTGSALTYTTSTNPCWICSATNTVQGQAEATLTPSAYVFQNNYDELDTTTTGIGNFNEVYIRDVPGTGHTGSRAGLWSEIDINGVPTGNAANYVSGQFTMNVNASLASTGFGNAFGMASTVATTGTPSLAFMTGGEFAVSIASGASVNDRYGIDIAAGGAVNGAWNDAALAIRGSATALWNEGLQFGCTDCGWDFGATSTLIGAVTRTHSGSTTPIALYGIDFSAVTFKSGGCAFRSSSTLTTYGGLCVDINGRFSPETTSAHSWTTGGLFASVAGGLALTDTTSSGTVAVEATVSFGGDTYNSTTATTYTQLATLFVSPPSTTGNATCTTCDAIYATGQIITSSDLASQAGLFVTGGTASLNQSSNFNTQINGGTSTGTITIGNASNTGKTTLAGLGAGTAADFVCVTSGGVAIQQTTPCLGGTLSGTSSSLGGSALLAGACSTTTVSITGATTAMGVAATPVTYPGAGNFWQAYVSSANTVTVAICAAVADTPTASTYNVRVLQ